MAVKSHRQPGKGEASFDTKSALNISFFFTQNETPRVNDFDFFLLVSQTSQPVACAIYHHVTTLTSPLPPSLTWGASMMPKIPEITVGSQMERSVSVRCDRNIRRWFTLICRSEMCRSIFANRLVALPLFSRFHLCGRLGKGIENSKNHSSRLARFDRKVFDFSLVRPTGL